MAAHGFFPGLRIALPQGGHDVTMLADEYREGRGFGQAEMAHAVSLGAGGFHHPHRVIAIDAIRDGPVEGFVEFREGHIVEVARRALLRFDQAFEPAMPALSIRPAASRTTAHSMASRTKRAFSTSFTEILVT